MTLVRGAALETLVRGTTHTRAGPNSPTEHFAAQGDAYTLAYDRPDTRGRYRVTPDRVCLRFPDERSVFCRFYLTDPAGAVWMAEDDRDYPLRPVSVTVTPASQGPR
ncbi:MAG: hypothetical protein PGN08_12360 [Sphingomonas taxi]